MLKRYPKLQSGFLSIGEALIIKPEVVEPSPVAVLLSARPTRTQQELFYAPAVDNFVDDLIQTPLVLRNFEKQGEFLETIGKVFEKQSFASFIRLQENNPELSSAHIQFLEETVKVALGLVQQRTISLQTWASMLSAANPGKGLFRSSVLMEEMKDTQFHRMTLGEFVALWLANAGWQDLAISMQVIFGRRSLHASYGSVL